MQPDQEVTTFLQSAARQQVIQAALTLRADLARSKRRAHRDAWAAIETYIAVSLRVLDRTPMQEIKSSALTEAIKARLDGKEA